MLKFLKKSNLLILLILFIFAMFGQKTQAATITWGTIQDATGNASDIVKTGTYVDSATSNMNNVTVSDILFNRSNTTNFESGGTLYFDNSDITFGNVEAEPTDAYGHSVLPTPTWDIGYKDLLRYGVHTNTGSKGAITINLGDLINGNDYIVQLWTPYWDTNNWKTEFKDFPNGNSSGFLNTGYSDTRSAQFVVGTFTADATTQIIYVYGNTGHATPHAVPTGLQLRTTSTPVPVPSTISLLGLGILGVAGVGRRKK